jgi:hypothetical protein
MSRTNHIMKCLGSSALVLALSAAGAQAAPKRVSGAKPVNCVACHGKEQVLPADHPKLANMKLASCRECHVKGDVSSLDGKLPLSHKHLLAGLTCAKCHGKAKKQEPVDFQVCVGCHEPEKLAQTTSAVRPQNPHTSRHYGTALDCNACHHQHAKSEDFCGQCHKFQFKLP